jgi:chromosome segregation ATPase
MADVDPALVPVYVTVGGLLTKEVVQGGAAFVRWLGERKTKLEDEKVAALKDEVKELQDQREEMLNKLGGVEQAIASLGDEQRHLKEKLDTTLGALRELREAFETGRDKQAAFYREQLKEVLGDVTVKLEKLEYDLRQDTTRAIHDAQVIANQKSRRKG